eukprot:6565849-Heterocapsa_arctica.AAC.1
MGGCRCWPVTEPLVSRCEPLVSRYRVGVPVWDFCCIRNAAAPRGQPGSRGSAPSRRGGGM